MAEGDGGLSMPQALYMVVENFKNKDAVSVYRRFRDRGRMAPEGLTYVSSWVDEEIECCFQLMETHDRKLLDQWMANWSDLVNFEVHAVVTSKEAAERMAPLL
jgi:Protein of unknown function (DUF3303)